MKNEVNITLNVHEPKRSKRRSKVRSESGMIDPVIYKYVKENATDWVTRSELYGRRDFVCGTQRFRLTLANMERHGMIQMRWAEPARVKWLGDSEPEPEPPTVDPTISLVLKEMEAALERTTSDLQGLAEAIRDLRTKVK